MGSEMCIRDSFWLFFDSPFMLSIVLRQTIGSIDRGGGERFDKLHQVPGEIPRSGARESDS